MHRRSLTACQALFGEENPETLTSIEDLVSVLQDQGQHEAAEQLHRQVLDVREAIFGNDDPNTLESVKNVAVTLRDQGKFDAAR